MLGHQGLDGGCSEIVGTHLGEGAAEAADRGSDGIAHINVTHRFSPSDAAFGWI